MGEPGGASTAVPVYVGGLDGTMARSVVAYFEARQVGRFAAAERRGATILLIDLDQPGAGAEIDAATEEQIVVGVGFGREPAEARCRHYAQKPLTGSVLIDTLSDVLLLLGASPATTLPRRTAVGRASHARDIFTTGHPYVARDQSAANGPGLVRSVRHSGAGALGPPRPGAPGRGSGTEAGVDTRRTSMARPVHIPVRTDDLASPGGPATAAEKMAWLDVEEVPVRDGGDLRDPTVLAGYRYSPAEHVDGILQRAVRAGGDRMWELRGPLVSVAADPATGMLLVSTGDEALRSMCARPAGAGWSGTIRTVPPAPEGRHSRSVQSLLWNTAVWSSRGRLPDTVDPFVPVRVRAWPDLTRCALTPSVLAVVALLAAGAHPPAEVADLLGIPRSHAFVAMAGLEAAGLLERPDPTAVPIGSDAGDTPPPPSHNENRGLIRRFLTRLRDA